MDNLALIKDKVYERDRLRKMLHVWRFKEQKIVFTNGCFDLLHLGHVHFLSQAADFGDQLIVGLNSDNSVRKNKGDERPINNQETRSMLLASFFFVSGIVVFEEKTPHDLITFIEPDVLVKGSDWAPEDIVGSDFVKQKGGTVQRIDLLKGHSTTNIEEKIKTNP